MDTEFALPLLVKMRFRSGCEIDGVRSCKTSYVLQDLAVGVEHHHVRASRDKDVVCYRIGFEIVPARVTAQNDLFNKMIICRR